jgi:plasmid stabilization system protein ParE
MSYRIELHPEALNELKESYQWYEDRSVGLGDRFMDAIHKGMQKALEQPERYAKKKDNYREIIVDTFPYVIIYEILKKEKVLFVSYIFHSKRNPQLKYRR